jgi:hypothetical protein
VKATVTPLSDGSGYMSVRVQASRDEIAAAESLYARMQGETRISLDEGEVVHRRGALRKAACAITGPWRNSVTFRVLSGGVLAVAILAVTAWGAANAIHDSGVDGERFNRIVQSKDLLADILPPPSYIVESHLVAHEMRDQRGSDLDASRARLAGAQGGIRQALRVLERQRAARRSAGRTSGSLEAADRRILQSRHRPLFRGAAQRRPCAGNPGAGPFARPSTRRTGRASTGSCREPMHGTRPWLASRGSTSPMPA